MSVFAKPIGLVIMVLATVLLNLVPGQTIADSAKGGQVDLSIEGLRCRI